MDINTPTAPEVIVNSTLAPIAPIAPTEPQIRFLISLLDELATYPSVTSESVEELREGYRRQYREHTLTKTSISAELGSLREKIRVAREEAADSGAQRSPIGSEEAAQVPAGRYAITGREGQTVFVQVVKERDSDAFMVNQQLGDDVTRMPRVIARSALQKILDAGVQESSMRYGREIGVCGVCGRTLTNEDSRQLGIGPICRAKLAG